MLIDTLEMIHCCFVLVRCILYVFPKELTCSTLLSSDFFHDSCYCGRRCVNAVHNVHEIDILLIAIPLTNAFVLILERGVVFVAQIANSGKVPVSGFVRQ